MAIGFSSQNTMTRRESVLRGVVEMAHREGSRRHAFVAAPSVSVTRLTIAVHIHRGIGLV